MITFPKLRRSKEHLLNKQYINSTKICIHTSQQSFVSIQILPKNQLHDCNQTSLNLYTLIPPNAQIQTNTYM